MIIDKIKTYLFIQILKYFILILFIFLSISWLLQITRLFTISNFLHIEVIDIILLSFYLIPNLITVIVPFILIFGLLLCFMRLSRDNELIAILTLGLGLKPIRNALLIFYLIFITIFTLLNFYIAPKIYEVYKNKEFDLRNTLDLNKMSFSNFLNINKTTVLDFDKKDQGYEDIFISFNDDKENLIFAEKGTIFSENNQYNFLLTNGFKLSIDETKQIEKLEFLNYILKIDYEKIKDSKMIDRNTFTIYDDYKSKNYLNISFKIIDIFLFTYIILFFYNNNIKDINFNSINNIYFSSNCIIVLILNQILKNSDLNLYSYILLVIIILLTSLSINIIKNKYEKN